MEQTKDLAKRRREFLTQPIEPDPVIELYKKDVDRTLLIENLRRGPEWRTAQFLGMQAFYNEAQARRRERKDNASVESGANTPRPS